MGSKSTNSSTLASDRNCFTLQISPAGNADPVKEFMLHITKRYLLRKNCPLFTGEESDEEILDIFAKLETWTAPEFLRTSSHFPFYYTGRTADGTPIWVFELGKADPRLLLQQTQEVLSVLDKTGLQMFQLAAKSAMVTDGAMVHFRRFKIILDAEGATVAKISNFKLLSMGVDYMKRYLDVGDVLLDEVVVINANSVVNFVLRYFGWLIGKLLSKVTIYGRDKDLWTTKLREHFPAYAIPEKYGGELRRQPLFPQEYGDKYQQVSFPTNVLEGDVLPL